MGAAKIRQKEESKNKNRHKICTLQIYPDDLEYKKTLKNDFF